MGNEYNYDIFLNKEIIATVGPSTLKQLHISFGVSEGRPLVKASGISNEEPGLLYINWLEEIVDFGDSLRVSPSQENKVTSPRHTKKLKRGMGSTEEDSFCEFCKGSEKETGQLIRLGG
ncbi:MAG: hypothetical protein GKR92_06735 [Gammaproteobacteria bacterium]|nr:MAG: hypothetical protein GKR92_06735 [Gammaproteobacteria bacterium]